MTRKFTFFLILMILPFVFLNASGNTTEDDYNQAKARFEQYVAKTAGQLQWYYVFREHIPEMFLGQEHYATINSWFLKSGIRDGELLMEMLGETWVNEWENESELFYTYDQNDFLIQMLMMEWDINAWVNSARYDITNNASGQAQEMLLYIWDPDIGDWSLMAKMNYTYNAQGDIIEMVMYLWADPVWMGFQKIIYTYSNGQTSEILTQSWDFMTQQWVNLSRDLFTYNANGWVILELSENWVNNAWENGEKETLNYNGQGQHIESLVEWWTGSAWENYLHYLYTYNGSGYLTEELEQMWDGTGWMNNYLNAYTYDANWNIHQILEQIWDEGVWVNSYRETYSYEPVGIADETVNAQVNSITTYPNPFTRVLNLEYTLENSATVSGYLYDLSGKRIDIVIPEEAKKEGTYKLTWAPSTELQKGIYFLTININGNSRSYKIVKN